MNPRKLASWIIIAAVIGFCLFQFIRRMRHPTPWPEKRAEFGVLYDDSRRMLQYYTKCLPSSDDQKAAEVRHFSLMRNTAIKAQFGDVADMMDLQEMFRSRPPGEPNQDEALTCRRLAYLGPITAVQVDQAIAKADSFARNWHGERL